MRNVHASSLFLALTLTAHAPAAHLWWEGEDPVETNFPEKTWFSASTFAKTCNEILSGGDWLTHAGEREGPEAFARYRVTVPATAEYDLWCRKFWKHGPFRWRFGDGGWETCGRDVALADSVPIRQHLCVNWVHLGKKRLTRGEHTFELRLLAGPGESQTACFDAFLLTTAPFTPRGKLKPGEKSGAKEAGWWALEPPPDPFEEAALDLRRLNEKVAGESGPVRRDGDRFVLGDGTPVRFWAVNCGGGVARLDVASQRYLARRLAKVGVNMVRIHGAVFDRRADDPKTVDLEKLAGLQRFVAALKAEGIYTHLSFYFPLWMEVRPSHGLPGYENTKSKHPFALLYFDPAFQEIYRAWARTLLTTPNPETGLSLGKDPAVAIVEIVNEDSFFFWTFTSKNVPPPQMRKLEKRFGAWLEARYGSLAKAREAWGGAGQRGDAPDEGRMAVLDVWHLTEKGHGSGAKRKRMSDQLRFLAELQRAFYVETVRFFREGPGLVGLVSASNWHTADAVLLDPIERYTYTAADVIDRHGYFSPRHEGPRASYSVSVGDKFTDRSALKSPEQLPIQFNQVAEYPQIISEIGWSNPNRFKAEMVPLAAAYGSVQGVDGFFFFAIGGPSWESSARKFPLAVPAILGQFPAFALAYRRGDIKEGPVVVGEALAIEDLYDFGGGAARAEAGLDAFRAGDVPTMGTGSPEESRVDPLAYYVGRVVRRFDQEESRVLQADLGPHVNRRRQTVTSATGEVKLDWATGLLTIDTACTQAAAGFLSKAGRVDLKDVTIEGANEYASISVTSLDGRPIRGSNRILVQAATEEKPYGWRVEGDTIADLGGFPMLIRDVGATVTLKHYEGTLRLKVLDPHGYVRPDVPVHMQGSGRGMTLTLPLDAMYLLIERE